MNGELSLHVSGPAIEDVRSDSDATTMLLRELHNRAGVDIRRRIAPSESGAKSGAAMSVSELVVSGTLSTTAIVALSRVVVAFIRRGAARTITLKDGARTITVTDPSSDTERAVADWLRTLRKN